MRSFKRVCKSVLAFLLVIALVSAMLAGFYLHTEYYYYQDFKERGDLTGTLDTLYCGASFALRAFRPDIIDPVLGESGYNLSGSRLTMLGRYTLLEKEIKRNPIKTVILEVSCDTLVRDSAQEGPEGELLTFARLTARDRPAYFFQAFRPKDWPLLYYDLVSKGINDACSLLCGRIRVGNWFLTRGYFPFHEPDVPFYRDYAAMRGTETLPAELTPYNIEMLDRITALCRENGVELVLINVPQSKAFNCSCTNLDVFHQWYADYAAKNGLQYYNFNLCKCIDTRLPDEGCFYDPHHLNNAGAAAFSEFYADFMRRIRAEEDLRDEFYASYAEMLNDPAYLG